MSIKIENVMVAGLEPAIRGMRNPKNSWDRSDSFKTICEEIPDGESSYMKYENTGVGKNDLELMTKLSRGGPVHAKYRRFIDVYVDITAPLYFWKEFKTYRKGKDFLDEEDFYSYDGDHVIEDYIEINSCSTMHKIADKEFTLDDFSYEHLNAGSMDLLNNIIDNLNYCRHMFINQPSEKEWWWWQLIQLLPSSYNQRRTVKLTYEVLGAMYHWRKKHKLDEWVEFCHWIETLPCSEIITGGNK